MSVEILIVSLVLLLGALPLAIGLWRGRGVATRLCLAAAGVAWVVGALAFSRAQEGHAKLAAAAPGRPVERPAEGYSSSTACLTCHPQQYGTWHDSYHRRMTQLAKPETVLPHFDGVEFEHGFRYRLSRRGDEFWVTTDDSRFAGESGESEHRIVLVTGSHHMQVFWFEAGRGRTVVQLPYYYRVAEQRWVPPHGALLTEPRVVIREPGSWNRVCLRCHTTRSIPRWGDSIHMDTEVTEFGIACESCHGPGQAHVERQRNPLLRYGHHLGDDRDDSIVNPAKLDAQASVDVCGRCHSVHSFRGIEDTLEWSEHGIPWQPGESLDRALHVHRVGQSEALPAVRFMQENWPWWWDERFWPDGMVSIVGREYNGVTDSPCFRGGEFTCTSCHELHQAAGDPRPRKEWANDQLAAGMASDQACLQCHQDMPARLTAHTHHAAESEGSRCMNCHMPHTAYGLLQASRVHLISSPDTANTLQTGRPNACNLCHLDQTLPWTARHLEAWYGIPAPSFDTPEQQSVANAALAALSGHAAQRALVAWHMGWGPAQEISRTDWMVPVLVNLMGDPYPAVRFLAHRSLRSIEGFEDTPFDYLASQAERQRDIRALSIAWAQRSRRAASPPRDERVLHDATGRIDRNLFRRLLAQRDTRRVYLAE